MLTVSIKDPRQANIVNVLVRHDEKDFVGFIHDLHVYSGLSKTKLINIVGKYRLSDITIRECYNEIVKEMNNESK